MTGLGDKENRRWDLAIEENWSCIVHRINGVVVEDYMPWLQYLHATVAISTCHCCNIQIPLLQYLHVTLALSTCHGYNIYMPLLQHLHATHSCNIYMTWLQYLDATLTISTCHSCNIYMPWFTISACHHCNIYIKPGESTWQCETEG